MIIGFVWDRVLRYKMVFGFSYVECVRCFKIQYLFVKLFDIVCWVLEGEIINILRMFIKKKKIKERKEDEKKLDQIKVK